MFSERQASIIEYIESKKRIDTATCASLLNISGDTALRELTGLKSKGVIIRKGVGRAIYYMLK